MIPQTVNHMPVRAAIKMPAGVGEVPEQYMVIVEDFRKPIERGYVVWHVSIDEDGGTDAFWGHYDLSWELAVQMFATRAEILPEQG